ncbi:P-loop containing nucleoside triphosphate hydrolase protein [Polyporus arcularius HHB13444]|uniref:P-loop containing nucleoside triphosphate hydrolase protein n=1 Tax=Polyporus arcularius HHB13444 TaxID=1314778 RepID=A0A5C3PHK9_9APHY|nr:P-loop containing nucleoside triphosphate hydrolase protein [Polyporus arcularius HHB13444]
MQGHQATHAEGSTSTSNLSGPSQDNGQCDRGSTELHNATTSTDASTAPIVPTGQQVVLLLVGLIGSGKSTFAQALERYFPQFQRCSQDELGDRRSVEALARRSLRDGVSVIIDRTNFDESQRATWINIANEFQNTVVWVLVFDTPYEVCAARVAERTGHPTITSPELGLQVLQRFRSQYRPPAPHEGYTRILYLKPSDLPDPECSEDVVRDVMRRLQDTPEVLASPPPPPIAGQYRSYREYRGGFRGFEPRGRSVYRGGSSYRGAYRDGAQGMHQTNLPWSPSRPPRNQDAPSPPWGNGPPAFARGPYHQGLDERERGSGYAPTQDNWRRS